MKKLFALVAVGLLILGAASCDTKNIGNFGIVEVAPTITSATFNAANDTLTVALSDPNAADIITVTCSAIAGLSVDNPKTFSKTGSVVFNWTATDPAAGGTGTTTITASDGQMSDTDTAVITVDPVTPSTVSITAHSYTEPTLSVSVANTNAADVTVAVSSPAGLTPDAASKVVAGGTGTVTFTWAGAAGTTGVTTITATEGTNTDSATETIAIGTNPDGAPVIVSHDYTEPTLTVVITNAPATQVTTVSVSSPACLTPDAGSKTVTGDGTVTFTWTGAPGTTGDTTITADDGVNAPVTATQTISIAVIPDTAPVIVSTPYAEPTLTVNVTNAPAGQDVTISVTSPAGLTPDAPSKVLTGGNGAVTFTWTGAAGTTGDTTITADDGVNAPVTATQTITLAPSANGAPVIVSHNFVDPVLTVVVTDPDAADDPTVTVTVPAGLAVDNAGPVNAGAGGGTVNFTWSAADPFAGGTGDTTITVSDGVNPDVVATQTITIAAWPIAADTLYVRPAKPTAAVGEAVTVYCYTGQPANALQFLSSVGVTIENAVAGSEEYVPSSFNIGGPGGGRTTTDGYWALMTNPAIVDDNYLDLPSKIPGAGTLIPGNLHRYNFAVVPMGPSDAPAAVGTGTGPMLFTFQVAMGAAGTYHLAFQLNDGSFDQTYYSDAGGTNYFWATLDNSNTITVTP